MSKPAKKSTSAVPRSPIRKISADEQPPGREWPGKKWQASNQPAEQPRPRQKNRIHSVLTALPFLMLFIGLAVYFKQENSQQSGSPILSESIVVEANYTGLSVIKAGSMSRHFIWLESAGKPRGARVTPAQAVLLKSLPVGAKLTIRLAPTVAGSSTLWAYAVEVDGENVYNRDKY